MRPLEDRDLEKADRILRMAFGTFLGLEDPMSLWPGLDYVSTRYRADRTAAFAAELDGELVGSNFLADWGSFGFFGPITVHPDHWNRKVAQALLERTMACFDDWGIEHRGLFTFPQSPGHIHLYEKYGFHATHLTPVTGKDVSPGAEASFRKLSALPPEERQSAVAACGSLTGQIHDGLDVGGEVLSVVTQGLGEVCLVHEDELLAAFAVCHCGPGTEGGDGTCFVKFGAVRPGEEAERRFERLLAACEAVAGEHGLPRLSVGMNMGRRRAYHKLLDLGFRTQFIGVAMETRLPRSYNRPDVFVIDDWR